MNSTYPLNEWRLALRQPVRTPLVDAVTALLLLLSGAWAYGHVAGQLLTSADYLLLKVGTDPPAAARAYMQGATILTLEVRTGALLCAGWVAYAAARPEIWRAYGVYCRHSFDGRIPVQCA